MEITGAWALNLPFGPTAKFRLYQGSACRRWIRPRGCGPLGIAPSSPWLTSSSPPFPGLRQGCSSFLILDHLLQVREWVWSGLISGQGICLQVEGRRFETTGVAWRGKCHLCPDQASRGTWFEADRTNNVSGNMCQNWEIRHKNPGFWVVLKMDSMDRPCSCHLSMLQWLPRAETWLPLYPGSGAGSHCPNCFLICHSWPPASSLRVFIGTQLPWGT